ncbi:MAG TPA: caspase family protein [Anaerolineae bacterium]|nr:caspase family protein [Anaerolineae bacterium]HNU02791.1 caspase family protein [Anaerolineae bacterium]
MTPLPSAHALLAGIAAYQHVSPLPATVLNDARAVYDVLAAPERGGYARDHVTLLLDGAATTAALRQALADLAQRCDADATALIYLSCHGARIEQGPQAGQYLLPVDADASSPQALAATAISGAEFTDALRAIPARKVVVIFDCCHAGGIGQPKDALAPALQAGLTERYYEALLAGRGRVILASSRSDEFSYALAGAPNSVFTTHLLAGLRGDVAADDGLIRIFDLFEYLQPRVTAAMNGRQHPVFKAEIEENFPVALRLGGQAKAVARAADGYLYDAYLIYAEKSERDREWVWRNLIPPLEDAGLRVAISADVLQAGVARVATVQRGMQQARRTVVVLSQAFLSDAMATFEAVLAQTIGIDLENAWRVVPVLTEAIDQSRLPYTLASPMAEPIDLVAPLRPAYGLPRLVRALQGPPPAILPR